MGEPIDLYVDKACRQAAGNWAERQLSKLKASWAMPVLARNFYAVTNSDTVRVNDQSLPQSAPRRRRSDGYPFGFHLSPFTLHLGQGLLASALTLEDVP